MGTILFVLRLMSEVDSRLRKHIARRGELVALIVLILDTVDLTTIPVLELSSDFQDLAATTVKLPVTVHAKLKEAAQRRQSSMNALINSAIWVYTRKTSKDD